METKEEISKSIIKKGAPYFELKDLELFINEINEKYDYPISSYKTLLQEENSVQLECSFLTKKAIFDFVLKKKSIECHIFFLKNIKIIKEEINPNNKTLSIYNGETVILINKAYNEVDKKLLGDYVNSIVLEINKL